MFIKLNRCQIFKFGCVMFLALSLRPAISYGKTAASEDIKDRVIHVSMIELISRPEKFNGKKVLTEGVFFFDLSESSIYASQEWYRNEIAKNAIVVRMKVTSGTFEHFAAFSGKYVLVQGTFKATDCGELCQYSGAISDVKLVRPINP